MKQIEVTVKVNNTLEEIDELLKSKGFKLIRKSRVEDDYVCPKELKVDKNNILEVLSSCVLIRYLKTAEDEFKKLTYKNKEYSKDGVVISEEKINVSIDDTKKAQELFEKINFKKFVSVHYDVIVYSNNNYEFAFQNVEGLGLLLEFENENDFEGVSDAAIVNEKQKMYEIIKTYGIKVENNYDIKKAVANMLYYLSSDVYMSDYIRNNLDYKNKNIYLVRYLIDTVVSNRVAGIDMKMDYTIYGNELLVPDLTLFVYTDEQTRQSRITSRGKTELDAVLDDDEKRQMFLTEFKQCLPENTIYVNNSSSDLKETINKIYQNIKNIQNND